MTNIKHIRLPSSLKFLVGLLNVLLVVYILYLWQNLFVSLLFSIFLALLLNPFTNTLEKWKIPRVFAIIISMLIVAMVVGGFVYMFYSQVIPFANELPKFLFEIRDRIQELQIFIYDEFDVPENRQVDFLSNTMDKLLNNSGVIIQRMLSITTNLVSSLALIPIYLFLFLFYRDSFRKFILRITPVKRGHVIKTIFNQTQYLVQNYLVGLAMVILIVGVLNSTGLLILGIKYAILLGFMAALLTIIPYIGTGLGALFAAIVAFLTKDSAWYVFGTLGIFWIVQVLEGNIITPKIVGGHVKINPLAAILSLVVFGKIWGTAGLILAIPITAIIKVVFDNVSYLKPYAFLLGSEIAAGKMKSKSAVSTSYPGRLVKKRMKYDKT